MKVLIPVIIFVLAATGVRAQICSSQFPTWTSENGELKVNGNTFHLKGTSWFGMETETNAPHGLWSHSVAHFINVMKDNNFNAMRFPFAVQLVLSNPSDTDVVCGANGNYVCNLNYLDLMEYIIDQLGEVGIIVMLDQHRLNNRELAPMWYDNIYTEQKTIDAWDILLTRFGHKWNVFALDLTNEPYNAEWGKGDITKDWNKAAERIINHIAANHPNYKGLFFVEGVGYFGADSPNQHNWAHFWGSNLEGVHRHPINTGSEALNRRVVYSPHIYGPDVYHQDYFNVRSCSEFGVAGFALLPQTGGTPELAANFPANMPEIWQTHFGFTEALTGRASVVGEWGGFYRSGTIDRTWQDAMSDWFIANCQSDQFYWCLNPNSDDTGGILNDDWTTVNVGKLELLQRTQPYPSKLTYNNGQYCLTPGAYANSACASGTVTTPAGATTTTTTTSAAPVTTTTTQAPTPATSTQPPSGDACDIQITSIQTDSWGSGASLRTKITLKITNLSGQTMPANTVIRMTNNVQMVNMWNMQHIGGDKYQLPSWLTITPGQSYEGVGGVVAGGTLPQFVLDSCPSTGGGGAPTTTTTTTTTTTQAPTTTTTTQASSGGGGGSGNIQITAQQTGGWQNGGQDYTQLKLIITNLSSQSMCQNAVIRLTNGVQIDSKWNMVDAGPNLYQLPSWLVLTPGQSYQDVGMIVIGKTLPQFVIHSYVAKDNCWAK